MRIMSGIHGNNPLTLSQKKAQKANQRERATCDQNVKAIEEEKVSTLEKFDRATDSYLSKLARYEAELLKQKEKEKKTGDGDGDVKQRDDQKTQLYLTRRRWSTIF